MTRTRRALERTGNEVRWNGTIPPRDRRASKHLLANRGVEAVYVATPNDRHADVVEACARAGKHVLCEKPMATTLDDARRMVAACERAGVRYATAFDQRFHAAHRRLRDLVAGGALGVVAQARIHYACWLPADWSERQLAGRPSPSRRWGHG